MTFRNTLVDKIEFIYLFTRKKELKKSLLYDKYNGNKL